MKFKILILLLFLSQSSCISLSKAERVPGYELRQGEKGLTQFHFQAKTSIKDVKEELEQFFRLKNPITYRSFSTSIFADKDFQVFMKYSTQSDTRLWLTDLLPPRSEIDDIDLSITQTKLYYMDVQVKNENGQDALAHNSLYRQKIIDKLRELRNRFH